MIHIIPTLVEYLCWTAYAAYAYGWHALAIALQVKPMSPGSISCYWRWPSIPAWRRWSTPAPRPVMGTLGISTLGEVQWKLLLCGLFVKCEWRICGYMYMYVWMYIFFMYGCVYICIYVYIYIYTICIYIYIYQLYIRYIRMIRVAIPMVIACYRHL